jgi:GTP-binding protein
MLPVIALVGRPNVGKSTLFNRLTKTRDALVADFSGLTRDRKYGEATFEDKKFLLIDTGGILGDEEGIDALMANQSYQAMDEADVVFFLVDGRAGMTGVDRDIAQHLRRSGKPFTLVVNKIDGIDPNQALAEFYSMGIEHIMPIAASQGTGIRQLLQEATADFPEAFEEEQLEREKRVKMAIIGRPNVGKSTLVNRMLGEDRVVVFDMPGTTRDSIYIDYERNEKLYTIIDTAGVRRRKNVKETVEKFSIVKTLQAVQDANVVVVVMDAQEGLVDQDLHMLGFAIENGRGLVIAINKWDGLDTYQRERIKADIERRLRFANYADIHFISALHGSGVGVLYKSIDEAYRSATAKFGTHMLTQILEGAIFEHQPPSINGRRIKLRYAHSGGHNPPIIVIHGNQTDKIPEAYKRYLEKVFRRELNLQGTPMVMMFKGSENPYANKKAPTNSRQAAKERRLAQVKKGRQERKK